MVQCKVQLGTNTACTEETNDRFEIDIFMWALGSQFQNGQSQQAGFTQSLISGVLGLLIKLF